MPRSERRGARYFLGIASIGCAGAGRVVVQGGAGRFRLHLDTHLGIGWHEEWGSFVYEEEELAAVAKQ